MGCLDENQALDFIEGRTADEQRAAVISHMAACGSCRRLVSELGRTSSPAYDDTVDAGTETPRREHGDAARAPRTIDRFEIQRVLGRGGMGLVYEARDPELGRQVAVKVLRSQGGASDPDRRARLVREARALAQLSHPNIVAIYEAGVSGEDVYIALELVRGATLREWLASTPRSQAEILDHLADVGDALAAAHDAGLVHRDVKPDNILVGKDGRARLADFGLVTAAGELPAPGSNLAPSVSDEVSTETGAVVGTPAFMAPEQRAGSSVDARTDQFAFCVTACEVLTGTRPKIGTSGIATAQLASLPRRIAAVFERGLARAAGERFPSMRDLLDALARGRRPPRWRGIAIGLAATGAIATAAVIATILLGDATDVPCDDAPDRLAAVWNAERRATILAQHASDLTRMRLVSAVDDWGAGWTEMRTAACRATLVDHAQSEELLDARMRCLDRHLAGVAALVDGLANAATTGELDADAESFPARRDLAVCADLDALRRAVPLPANAGARAQVIALEKELASIQSVFLLGKTDEAVRRSHAVVERSRALDYPPLLARALLAAGSYDDEKGLLAQAERELREAMRLAAAARDDDTEARAWAGLVETLTNAYKNVEALAAGEAAEAALSRARSSAVVRYSLFAALSESAEGMFDYERSLAWQNKGLATVDSELEPNHPTRGSARVSLASRLVPLGRQAEALELARAGLAIVAAYYGTEHQRVVWAHVAIGRALMADGKAADALPSFERARAIAVARLGRVSAHYVYAEEWRGHAFEMLGRDDDALASYRDLIAASVELTSRDDARAAEGHAAAAMIDLAHGRLADADAGLREALRIYRTTRGNEDVYVARTLARLAAVAAARHDAEEAIADLEEAVRIAVARKKGIVPVETEYAKAIALLARLLWEHGPTTHTRALAFADEAAGEMRRLGMAQDLAELEHWRTTAVHR